MNGPQQHQRTLAIHRAEQQIVDLATVVQELDERIVFLAGIVQAIDQRQVEDKQALLDAIAAVTATAQTRWECDATTHKRLADWQLAVDQRTCWQRLRALVWGI